MIYLFVLDDSLTSNLMVLTTAEDKGEVRRL